MMKRKAGMLTICFAFLIFLTGLLVIVRQPAFLFGLRDTTSRFDGVYVRFAVEPDTILFADQFKIRFVVTFDAREFSEDSIKFVIPTKGLVVHNEEYKKISNGLVVTVEKAVTVQCLSCLPRESPYNLGDYAVILKKDSGELKIFRVPQPQIRVASRLLPEDVNRFSLRPLKPVVVPMRPGMDFIPYLVFLGAVLSVLAIMIFVSVWFWFKSKKMETFPTTPAIKMCFQEELELVSGLRDALAQGNISPDEAVLKCYCIFRNIVSVPDHPLLYKLKLLVFGPPERVTIDIVIDHLSDVRSFIVKASQEQEG